MLLRFTYMYVNNTLTDGDVVRVRTRTFKPMVVVAVVDVDVMWCVGPARCSELRIVTTIATAPLQNTFTVCADCYRYPTSAADDDYR